MFVNFLNIPKRALILFNQKIKGQKEREQITHKLTEYRRFELKNPFEGTKSK